MSPGRRRNGAEPSSGPWPPPDVVVLDPAHRRRALLRVIDGARRRLVLSLFRCDDDAVLAGLAGALARGVRVEALLTARAKGGREGLRRLWDTLEGMGAAVSWYGNPGVKYHAKYLVADEGPAMVATLNPTRKCFTRTWDAMLVTYDRAVVNSLVHLFEADTGGHAVALDKGFSPRVIVGPERARADVSRLIIGARRNIRILDHKLSDPEVLRLLADRRAAGVSITVLGRNWPGPLEPHGKLMIVDEAFAVIGSMALSPLSLDARREVSLVIDAPLVVRRLGAALHALAGPVVSAVSTASGDWL